MAHVHAPGLVLRMDPDELLNNAAKCSCEEDLAVNAQHYFLCIAADAKEGWWVPLFTGPRVGTKEIPGSSKTGDPRWIGVPAHYSTDQVWRASHKAVQRAATAAHDRSTPKLANRVIAKSLPGPQEFPGISA
ncbi:MAG: hypothetical protein ABI411_09095 [Tahibacter sp.]